MAVQGASPGRGVIPDHPTQHSITDLLEVKDAELNYILGLIDRRRTRQRVT